MAPNRRRINIATKEMQSKRDRFALSAGPYKLDLGLKTKIMGIINMTPDSFSQDGCFKNPSKSFNEAYYKAVNQIQDGADILDIGGESTRPGAKSISAQEEIKRVIPLIKFLSSKIKIPLSVDTYKLEVAQAALDNGATIINNIMGSKPDKKILTMVKNYGAAIVLMHIKGTPQTMQKQIKYRRLIPEIINSLRNSIEKCLEIGIKSDRMIIDPGIGFGKTVEHNLEIINKLLEFKNLKRPILVGTSRKSFIGKVLDKDVDQRIIGSTATTALCIARGAHIIRVHDVKEAKETVLITDAVLNQKY